MSRPLTWTHRRMGQTSVIERLPQEVLERICQLLPASTKKNDCLSLLTTAKLWYAPAVRELFAFVSLADEAHANGVLATLGADGRHNGGLALTVRKLCLLVGDEMSRQPASLPALPPRPPAPAPAPAPVLGPLTGWAATFGGHAAALGALHGQGNGNPAAQQVNPGLHQYNNMHLANIVALTSHDPFEVLYQQIQHAQEAIPPAPPAVAPAVFNNAATALVNMTPIQTVAANWQQYLANLQQMQQPQQNAEAPQALPLPQQHSAVASVSSRPLSRSAKAKSKRQDKDDKSEVRSPLDINTALAVLDQMKCIQVLTLRLPLKSHLPPAAISSGLSGLIHLRKLDLECRLPFADFWQLMRAMPRLDDLHLSGLYSGVKSVEADTLRDYFDNTTLHLRTITLERTELLAELLYGFLRCCQGSLVSLELSGLVTTTRDSFRTTLQMIGSHLTRLVLRRTIFRTPLLAIHDSQLHYLVDSLPQWCPMLQELEVASEKVTSHGRFLSTVVPSLFLTQLGLDYYSPAISEEQLLDMIRKLPAGRMETLSLGPKLARLASPKVQRACQEIGVTVIAPSDD